MNRKWFKYMAYGFSFGLIVKSIFFPTALFDWGVSVFDTERILGFMLFLLIIAGDGAWAKMHLASPFLQGYNFKSTHSFKPEDILIDGDYAFIRAGGINAFGFSESGKKGTVVTHPLAYRFLENGILINAKVEKNIEPDELPTAAKNFIERNDLPKPVHYAQAPAGVEANNTAFVEWKNQEKMRNKGRNTVESLLDQGFQVANRLDAVSSSNSDSKLEGKVQRLKERLSEKNGEE